MFSQKTILSFTTQLFEKQMVLPMNKYNQLYMMTMESDILNNITLLFDVKEYRVYQPNKHKKIIQYDTIPMLNMAIGKNAQSAGRSSWDTLLSSPRILLKMAGILNAKIVKMEKPNKIKALRGFFYREKRSSYGNRTHNLYQVREVATGD